MLELTNCLSSAEQCEVATSYDLPAFLTSTRRIIKAFSILLYSLGAVNAWIHRRMLEDGFIRVCIFVNCVFAFILAVFG